MARKFYTVFVLPHTHARFRKIHLSRNFVIVLGTLLGVVLVAGLVFPHLLFQSNAQSERIARLESENRALRQEKQRFEASLGELGAQINTFEQEASRLAVELGLEEPPELEPAAGGPTDPDRGYGRGVQGMLDEELDALRSRTATLNRSLAQLKDAWVERERLLASTPNMMPVRGWFSDGYGWRKDPFTGKRRFHKGIDVVGPAGAVVRATADGVVTWSGRKAGYGKMVTVSHGYGFQTRYGHMSEILVKPGQRVVRGDAMGRVGSTGRSTGPHVHYEVVKEGRPVNPWRYLGDRKR
jgi:murein DD-endopeptidase MepM/ murein hydrolase activator NlpD